MLRSKKDLVAWLESTYKDDDILVVTVYDKSDIEDYVNDNCLEPARAQELWEQVAEDLDNDDYIYEVAGSSLAESVNSHITEEEEKHENCIEVINEAGDCVHQKLTALADNEEEA